VKGFFGALFMLIAMPTQAGTPNAAAILRACATGPGAPTEECSAYVNGVVTGVLVDQVARSHDEPICLPARVTTGEVILAITTFIAKHQDIWTKDGNAVVGVALQDAFPCQ
jgi:hypothetical protein